MIRVVLALVTGLALGSGAAALRNDTLVSVALAIEPLGTLWTNAIRMTVIPLVAALVITGVANQTDLRRTGRLGGLALVVFIGLLITGGLFAALVAPISFARLTIPPDVVERVRAGAASSTAAAEQMPSVVQRILEMVPANPIKAAAEGALLPLVVFTFIFAAALKRLEQSRREPVIRLFQALGDAMLIVVRWVLAIAPVGIFALAIGLGVRMGVGAASALLHYVLTVSATLFVFTLGLYPIAWLLGGTSVRQFAGAALPAQAVAFSSRSSLAALPALIAGARDCLGLPSAITGFALPLAVSVFRVGVPISWVAGALFLGRLYGVNLSTPAILGLVVTSAFISFSVPGIPGASLFLIAPVLVSLGLPAEGAGILLAVDAIPDMFKTTSNVTAHLAAAAVLGRFTWGPSETTAQQTTMIAECL